MKSFRMMLSLFSVAMLAVALGCQPPAPSGTVDVSTSTDEGSGTVAGSGSSNTTTGAETPGSNVTTGSETPGTETP